jgi:hypothetical protein
MPKEHALPAEQLGHEHVAGCGFRHDLGAVLDSRPSRAAPPRFNAALGISLPCSAGTALAIAGSRWRSGYSARLTARAGNRLRDFLINRAAQCQPRAPRSGARRAAVPLAAVAGDFEHRQLALKLAKGDRPRLLMQRLRLHFVSADCHILRAEDGISTAACRPISARGGPDTRRGRGRTAP